MPRTRPRAAQIRGLATQQAPYLADLIPDSYLPNNTGDFKLIGAFFTPDMVISVEGQTINRIKFINDNEVLVNLTTGAAEGTFDVTLNNGIEAVFTDVLLIVLGEVFTATAAEFSEVTNLDIDNSGNIDIKYYPSNGSAKWDRIYDLTEDFEIRFDIGQSELHDGSSFTDNITFEMLNVSDSSQVFRGIVFSYGNIAFGPPGVNNGALLTTFASSEYFTNKVRMRWSVADQTLTTYSKTGQLLRIYSTDQISENGYFRFDNDYVNVRNLKYIKLAT